MATMPCKTCAGVRAFDDPSQCPDCAGGRVVYVPIERDDHIRLDASLVNKLIRDAFKEGTRIGTHFVACDRALIVGKQCVSGLTDDQILAIARGDAELFGCTPEPIGYRVVGGGG